MEKLKTAADRQQMLAAAIAGKVSTADDRNRINDIQDALFSAGLHDDRSDFDPLFDELLSRAIAIGQHQATIAAEFDRQQQSAGLHRIAKMITGTISNNLALVVDAGNPLIVACATACRQHNKDFWNAVAHCGIDVDDWCGMEADDAIAEMTDKDDDNRPAGFITAARPYLSEFIDDTHRGIVNVDGFTVQLIDRIDERGIYPAEIWRVKYYD